MRNLAFFRPSQDLAYRLLEEGLNTPKEGLHATILNFCIRGRTQPVVVRDLSGLETEPFEVEVTGVEKFGFNGDGCYVLTLTRPQALVDLHNRTAEMVRDLEIDTNVFDYNFSRFGGDSYNPHITIHYGSYLPELKYDYEGMKFDVDKYYLGRKICNNWSLVASFKLGASVLV